MQSNPLQAQTPDYGSGEPAAEFRRIAGPLPENLPDGVGFSRIPTANRSQAQDAAYLLKNVPGIRTPVLFIDQNAIREQHKQFERFLPGVQVFFANKCFSAPEVVEVLQSEGGKFDAANGHELRRLLKAGVNPSNILVTKPIHEPIDLLTIAQSKPRSLVIQSASDLEQLRKVNIPNPEYSPEIIIRVKMPDPGLAGKFGAPFFKPTKDKEGEGHFQFVMTEAKKIVSKLHEIEAETGCKFGKIGLSTHLGTQNTDPHRLERGIRVFAQVKAELVKVGVEIKLFDLGGGFPDKVASIKAGSTQEAIMAKMGEVVSKYQAQFPDVEFIAEPGRYMVANSGFVVSRVRYVDKALWSVAEDGTIEDRPSQLAHLDDGVYSDFLGRWHEGDLKKMDVDGAKRWVIVLKEFQFYPMRIDPDAEPFSSKTVETTLSGPSCDSMDTLGTPMLPPLKADDLLFTDNMGAYVYNLRLRFNDIPPPQTCFYERNADGSYTYRLEDPEPIDFTFEEYLRLVQRTGLDEESLSKLLPASSAIFSGNTLSRIMHSMAGEVEPALLRPVMQVKKGSANIEFPLFDRNKQELELRDLSAIFEGGMGWVLKCTDNELNRTVALKVGKFPADSNLGQRFRDEAERMASFAHPSIPRVYSSGKLPNDNLPYFTMEFVEGNTLDKELPSLHAAGRKESEWREIETQRGRLLSGIKDAALALQYAHEKGVIHRDIKPQNLMAPINQSEPMRVLDFGLNKVGREEATLEEQETEGVALTRIGTVLGTVHYMSPEQARGEDVSKLTDVWALGATLYEMVCNKRPLSHYERKGAGPKENERLMLEALRGGGYGLIQPPSTVAAQVPPELEAIIMKALKVDPKERYQSAEEMAQDLENFLEKRPVNAHAESMNMAGSLAYSTKLFVQRKTREVALAGALTIASIGGLIGLNQYQKSKQELANTEERALTALASAEKLSQDGRLDEAIAALSPDLIDRLEKQPSLGGLQEQVVSQRTDLNILHEFKDNVFKVYSSLVDTFDFGTMREVDVAALGEAAKIYLPDGLTEEGIKKLKERLDHSKLTDEQKMQIGDRLIEWAVFQAGQDFPEVLIKRDKLEGPKHANEFLARVALIEKLAASCEKTQNGESKAWDPAMRWMKRTMYWLTGDTESETKIREQGQQLKSPRASALFLVGAFARESARSTYIFSSAIRQNFQAALLYDPDHFAANYLLSQTVYEEIIQGTPGTDQRQNLRFLIETLEDCRRLDPNNPFLLGRLAIISQMTWDQERIYDPENRINSSCFIQGPEYASQSIKELERRGLTPPVEILRAYGELAIPAGLSLEAADVLAKALKLDSDDARTYVMWACAEIACGRGNRIDVSQAETMLKKAKQIDDPNARCLPEVAMIYSFLGSKAQESADEQLADRYRVETLDVLTATIEKVPAYKGLIGRMSTAWFDWLKTDPDFVNLLKE